MKSIWLIILCLTVQCLFAQQRKDKIKVTDMMQIKRMSTVQISPDGSKALFVLNGIEPQEGKKWEYAYSNQLYIVPTDGSSAPRQLTYKENAAQPTWSPDGKQIAFVRAVEGKPQVFLLSLEGGEPLQLTKSSYGATSPKWSLDGKKILYAGNISLTDLLKDTVLNPNKIIPAWPYEKPGFPKNENLQPNTAKPNPDGNWEEIRAYLNQNATDKKAKVINMLDFQGEAATTAEMNFTHFFLTDATADATPLPVTTGFYSFNGADFTPDGKRIILSGNRDATQHPDRSLENEIYIVDADGKNMQLLLGEKGKNYSSPKLSPSGKWLAFEVARIWNIGVPELMVMPLNGTAKDRIALPFDRNKGALNWSADEKYLYFTAQSNGGAPVYRMNISTHKAEALTAADAGISSYDLVGDKMVFVKTEVANPSEVYTTDASGKNSKALTGFNAQWLQNKQLSFPEKRSFVNEKGLTVEYWIMKPTDYTPGKKYPAILNIHGGPSAMWGPGENSMWHEFQYYAAQGYAVVYGNPRGSGGYGTEFLRANMNDWGAGPTSDVLTYLTKATEEGFIDTSRMAVTGGSYAGYLVGWIVGHDHRFKAACAQRGVYDLRTFMGEGNAWRLVPNYFGGYPWNETTKAILERESPINYVAHVRTPLIIFHGENDLRTGVIQSEGFYKSLKILGREVEYVRHPGGTHELTRSGNNRQRIDQMLRTIEFFARYIQP